MRDRTQCGVVDRYALRDEGEDSMPDTTAYMIIGICICVYSFVLYAAYRHNKKRQDYIDSKDDVIRDFYIPKD
jgi:heme/copper-type cytochrome/quinol oxidase subunit 2